MAACIRPKPLFRRSSMKRLTSILASIGLAVGLSSAAFAADDDWAPVAQALGRSGAQLPGGIYRVGLGRSDLKVTVDEVTIRPTLALGSYLAFQKMGSEAMVMGDLVLLHEEVNPVMKKLVEGGIQITALHNHLLRSAPATMYMHFYGRGDPAKLATALHSHMLTEQPRLFFMHFWANDDAGKLARSLKAALGKVKLTKN